MSRTSPRVALLAGLALLLVACASEAGTQPPSGDQGAYWMVEYHRQGGIAGWNDHLVIYADGHCELTREGQPADCALGAGTVGELESTLEASKLFDLNAEYLPQNPCCDRFEYTIRYDKDGRSHTVRTMDGATPRELEETLRILNGALDGQRRQP